MASNALARIALRRLAAAKPSTGLRASRSANGRGITAIAPPTALPRKFSSPALHDHSHHDDDELEPRMPVTKFTEDEEMVRDAARVWADQALKPWVREMDNECKTRPEVIQGLFDHGFMGMVSKM